MTVITKVSNVSEEYKLVSKERCKCGGILEVIAQRLEADDSDITKQKDVLECICAKCSKRYKFEFDISEFAKKSYDHFMRTGEFKYFG